jgi:hypothetical protein
MARFIGAIVVGYAVTMIAVIVIFTAAYPVLGVDRLFEPGTYEAARGWIGLSFVIGFVAAMAGGAVCALVAPATKAPLWLATVVLVLGALMAIPVVMARDDARGGARPANITMTDAMTHARQPAWVALLNHLLGAFGILVGAGPRSRRD